MENKEIKNTCQNYFEKIKNVAKFKIKLKETMSMLNNNLNNSVSNVKETNYLTNNDNKSKGNIDGRMNINTNSNYTTLQKLRSSKLYPNSPQNEVGLNFENFETNNNYLTNISNTLQISNNFDKTVSMEFPFEKGANISKSRYAKSNEENFENRPTLEFYKAYCEELESTIEELMENMKEKTDKLTNMERLQTENMELKRKLNNFTKIISLSQIDVNLCEEETCNSNRMKLADMKLKYDKMIKNKNNAKLNSIIFS